jgi:hypothetical protein
MAGRWRRFPEDAGYGWVTVASADETAARLTINPNAEIANMRSMAALHRLPLNISTHTLNGK